MAEYEDLRAAGISTTSSSWITNPLRRKYFRAGWPYFAYILDRLSKVNSQVAEVNSRITEVNSRITEVKAASDPSSRLLDGLNKDQAAINYRLANIEDSLAEQERFLRDQLSELQARTTVPQPPEQISGLVTLPHNRPMAIHGTSLVLHDGPYGRFLLRQPDLISDTILLGGFWDAHLKPLIERAASPARSSIDAGAYLGFHSVCLSRYFRTVYAFEPQVEIFRMLCANLLLNRCPNVVATNAALYDRPGHMSLADDAQQEIPLPRCDGVIDYDHVGNAAALSFQLCAPDAPTAVEAHTIDQLGLDDLGFLKVDAQGSDLRVLRGARATIERCRPVITAEFERDLSAPHGTTADDYHRFFNELGYQVETLDTRSDGKQFDLLATPG